MGAAGQSFGGGLGVATLVLACLPHTLRSSAPGFTYTKYPSGDTYVSSCYEIYEFHDSEPVLLVRQNNPAYYLTEAYADDAARAQRPQLQEQPAPVDVPRDAAEIDGRRGGQLQRRRLPPEPRPRRVKRETSTATWAHLVGHGSPGV